MCKSTMLKPVTFLCRAPQISRDVQQRLKAAANADDWQFRRSFTI